MTTFPVEITPEAQAQLRKLNERKGTETTFVRIGVKGGGCSGLEYVMKLDERILPIDIQLELDGVKVVCDSKSATFLEGAKLIWTGNLIGSGFTFENPNADRSCGCGTSFMPKQRTST